MEKGSMYIKVWNDKIKECGIIDCGCEIEKVESPYIMIKLCVIHQREFENTDVVYGTSMISPCVEAPGNFENIHLAGIGEPVYSKSDYKRFFKIYEDISKKSRSFNLFMRYFKRKNFNA